MKARGVVAAAVVALVVSPMITTFAEGEPPVRLGEAIVGFETPTHVTHAADGSGRLFVVEQGGAIRIVRDGEVEPTPFLDIADRVGCGGGGGLLSVAFSPTFATDGALYVQYDESSCDVVIARFLVGPDPDVADPTGEELLRVVHLGASRIGHTGGQLAFGPDGFLYAALGDGSSANDDHQQAQDPMALFGKVLRLEVAADEPGYAIPASNPFVGVAGHRPEIWALGVRNPWRFSFDGATGDLFIADVGEDAREEIDWQAAGDPGGHNYGWPIMEGTTCVVAGCDTTGLTMPVVEYDHDDGCSVSGGSVYRGAGIPELAGWYVYGDFCSGRIWGAREIGGSWQQVLLIDTALSIVGFGIDAAGELWVIDHQGGAIRRLVAGSDDSADLVASTATSPPVSVGDTVVYTTTVTNVGPDSAPSSALAAVLPAGTTYLSAVATSGSCTRSGQQVGCLLGDLAVGAEATVTISARADVAGVLTSSATASSAAADPEPGNNLATGSAHVRSGPLPSLVYVDDVLVAEGDTGTRTAVFTLRLVPASAVPVVVTYSTTNVSATQPADYLKVVDEKQTFAPGETTKTVAVTVIGDLLAEGNHTFLLKVTKANNGALISDGNGTGTIVDEEQIPSIFVDDIAVGEGAGSAVVTVRLSKVSTRTVTVVIATKPGTATATQDYAHTSASLSFAPGETSKTFTVTIVDDALFEANHEFTVKLTGNKASTIADPVATVTIVDDE